MISYFCSPKTVQQPQRTDLVAQLVEQYTFNVWVLGSNPSRITTQREALQQVGGLFCVVEMSQGIGRTDALLAAILTRLTWFWLFFPPKCP